ncbi:MAG TPA: type I-E CRISPR-associated protein Cas7/Cse4/CasC [Polyangia bacterium]|jgi:CRISPR system Cascade subunit CasC
MSQRFLQIHTLTSYPGSLLNRDDAGFAKRLPFGGATRTRVSSQCLKRHWRTFMGEHSLAALGEPGSVRSRFTFEKLMVRPLIAGGVDEALARAVTRALMGELLGKSAKAKKEEEQEKQKEKPAKGAGKEKGDVVRTEQVTVLGRPEIEYLLGEARAICAGRPDPAKVEAAVKQKLGADGKKNLEALRRGAGLDAALFGRMVTGDILARCDAAVHVAHAFTVHEEAAESDYFSAVDELQRAEEDEHGSGHINSAELTSGLFYGYVVVDVPLLVSNLEGCERSDWPAADHTLAAEVVRSLVHMVATVSPGAKLGSTAPHAYAHLVLTEFGSAQPRTLANAFLRPVAERPDLLANTYEALRLHLAELDGMYGVPGPRQLAGLGPVQGLCQLLGLERPTALDPLARAAAARVLEP